MPITMLDTILAQYGVDFNKSVLNAGFVVPVVSVDPTGYEAGLIYNSVSKELKYHNGTIWVALGAAGSGGPPSGAAGGDLTGSYPTPQIAAGVIVDADVNGSAAIAQSKIANLTTDLAAKLPLAGGTMAGFITAHADPASAMHVATKQYVDLANQGYTFKNAVKVVSSTNQGALSGLLTIDGITLVANDRVLLAAQTTASQNGIWVAAAGAWARSADADSNGEIQDGALVPVQVGTTNADSQWLCTATGATPWVPGTSTSTWVRQAQLADLSAGAGLTKTGTTIDFVAGDTTLTVAADNVVVNQTVVEVVARKGAANGYASLDGTTKVPIAQVPTGTTASTVALGNHNHDAAYPPVARQIIAGAGLTGGGDLSADRTLNFVGDANLSVAADAVSVLSAPKWTTARSFTLTGDVTGTTSVDGSGNISLATTSVGAGTAAKHYAGDVGAGAAVVITHNLNSRDVSVDVYRNSTPWDTVECTVERTSVNTVTLKFGSAVSAAAYRCVVTGK